MLYHGWDDPVIQPEILLNYYRSVVARMGQPDSDQFIRLFMVPGLQHCTTGPGPIRFRQASDESGVSAQADPEHDISLALERWVEKGLAPEAIVAAKFVDDSSGHNSDPTKGILRTRPLCAYPQVARWKGTGSTDDAADFVCVKEKSGK
ncbi:MAG: tannase/feruloyl esterase family alpha/beta hydrolase [Acidobacteria bacterium]|nr:tannase/feruloyl esterase family alpha/beta hydrolase [Acidobacteriota bacterium]